MQLAAVLPKKVFCLSRIELTCAAVQGKAAEAPAWKLDFQSWKPGSPQYANLDSALDMQLTTLYFFCNRPTVAALMAIGTDLGDAFKDPQAAAQQQAETRELQSAASMSESEFDTQGVC